MKKFIAIIAFSLLVISCSKKTGDNIESQDQFSFAFLTDIHLCR